jgi:hypothetical protein
MWDWLDKVPPQFVGLIVVVVILREVFTFLKTKQLRSSAEDAHDHDEELVSTLKRINANIEANTDLIRGFISEMKELRRDIDGLRKDVDSLSDDVRRRPPTVP